MVTFITVGEDLPSKGLNLNLRFNSGEKSQQW